MALSALEKFIRNIKEFYSVIGNGIKPGNQGLDTFLFNKDDVGDGATFALDQLILNPWAVVFRNKDEQSKVRPYSPGTGNTYEVPHASEKTPISENLRDAVIAGSESVSSYASNNEKLFTNIINQHIEGHNAMRWKLALDTMRTGIFAPVGIGGESIGLDIDFGRATSQNVTYDFTAGGATMDIGLKEMYDAYRSKGGSPVNMAIIMGSTWLADFESDTAVQDNIAANTSNVLLEQNLMPEELQKTEGLYLIARYRIPGTTQPVWILGYEPRFQFIQYEDATAEAFMPATEAVMFSIDDRRYRVLRGMDAFENESKVIRVAGEVVFDSFTEKDPIGQLLRSQTRIAFVPGNVNYTARSTGTFS